MTCKRYARFKARLLVFMFFLVLVPAASAQRKEKVIYSFQGLPDGADPVGAVVFDQHGNLYGATQNGGSSSCPSIQQCGTVYQVAPPAKPGDPWTETVLYIFKGNRYGDGASPYGGLVIDSEGNLYGTTGYGGTGDCVLLGSRLGCGTVFELSPPKEKGGNWTETVLYSFPNAKRGYVPFGDLALDGAGNLYGATIFGGGYGTTCDSFYQYCGAVFRLSPPKKTSGKWTETVLHGFRGGADGAEPYGGLILDSKGNVYGTTFYGGSEEGECNGGDAGTGCGTVFALQPPRKGGAWAEKVLWRFHGLDGATPAAGVVFGTDGALYGTAFAGAISGNGAVFSLAAPDGGRGSWREKVLYRFTGEADGENPTAGLTLAANGDLYGTAEFGGVFSGTVFRLEPPSGKRAWTFSIVHGFTGSPDGAQPAATLKFDKHGDLYGTTRGGGTGQACNWQYGPCGTVFEVSP